MLYLIAQISNLTPLHIMHPMETDDEYEYEYHDSETEVSDLLCN